MKDHARVLAHLNEERWAITPDWLETLVAIAHGWHEHQALQIREGRPMAPERSVTMRGRTAVIPVAGPLFPRANMFTEMSGATSTQALTSDINAALENPGVDAIVLEIDSPGGAVTGIAEAAEFIRSARGIKPITAHVDGMAASGAYWLAAATDSITLAPTASVGSIGVVATYRVSKDEKTVEVVSSGAPGKRPDIQTDAGRQQIQAMVDRLESEFVAAVARYRDTDTDTVRSDFGQGGMLIGSDAVDAGMADGITTLENVLAGSIPGNNYGGSMSTKADAGGPAITLDYLRANHADLVSQIKADAIGSHDITADITRARTEGAEAERDRIKAVWGQGEQLAGHDALIQGLMFDGKTTGPEAAVAILAAEKQARGRAVLAIEDGPAPVGSGVRAEGDESPRAGGNTAGDWEAQWESDASIQAEFGGNKATYMAFKKAEATGRVRILGGK